jgi:hypothetical protein
MSEEPAAGGRTTLEGWQHFTARQRQVLRELDSAAEWRCRNGLGVQIIAWEGGQPVVYINDRHDAFVLDSDGTLRHSPEPRPEAVSG